MDRVSTGNADADRVVRIHDGKQELIVYAPSGDMVIV
jgi:hypothetical protein